MSINHLLLQSQSSISTGLGGRKEDISISKLTVDGIIINGDLSVAGDVGIGAIADETKKLLVVQDSSDAIVIESVGKSSNISNYTIPAALVLKNSDNTVGNYTAIDFKNASNSIVACIGAKNRTQSSLGSGDLYFATANSSGVIANWVNLTSDGKFGVGTANPTNVGGLEVGGATTLDTTLEVKGATTLDTTLEVKGDTTLDSNLEIKGTTLSFGNIDLSGNHIINQGFNTFTINGLSGTLDAIEGIITFVVSTTPGTGGIITFVVSNSFATTSNSFAVIVGSNNSTGNNFTLTQCVTGSSVMEITVINNGAASVATFNMKIYFKIFITA